MRYKEGVCRQQSQLLPPSVDEYVAQDHSVRVIDAFVDSLDLPALGFSKATPAATGCKPYSPGDLLKLYLYGYLNQTTSTRRLEKECHRNLEVIWLMKQLAPDFKTIADFRKDNGEALKAACKQFILFCRQAGLVSGALVAIDGSKFKAAASKDQVFTQKQLKKQLAQLDKRITHYLERLAHSEQQSPQVTLETARVSEALAYLKHQQGEQSALLQRLEDNDQSQTCLTEPDAKLMRSGRDGMVVGYNAQNVVENEHQLIIHHELTQASTDNRQLEPQVTEAQAVLDQAIDTVVADAGYSNGEQVAQCQSKGIEVILPANRAINTQGEFYQKADFIYLADQDAYRCPAGELLHRTTRSTADKLYLYSRSRCSACPQQERCTKADKRWVSRHFYEDELGRADSLATPMMMKKRMAVVEPPFATLKRLLNGGRFRCWGLTSAGSEYSLGVLSYNLMRAINVMGVKRMIALLG